MFCREQAAHFQARHEAFDARGVALAALGSGNAAMAAEFVRQFSISFPVYTDPGRRAFTAAGMRYRTGIGLATVKNAARALGGGFLQGRTRGHAKQQGGVMLIGTDGEVHFAYREDGPGEHIAVDEVLEAIRTKLPAA
jgi:peroxiredoxin